MSVLSWWSCTTQPHLWDLPPCTLEQWVNSPPPIPLGKCTEFDRVIPLYTPKQWAYSILPQPTGGTLSGALVFVRTAEMNSIERAADKSRKFNLNWPLTLLLLFLHQILCLTTCKNCLDETILTSGQTLDLVKK